MKAIKILLFLQKNTILKILIINFDFQKLKAIFGWLYSLKNNKKVGV